MRPWLAAGGIGLAALIFLLPRHHVKPWPRELAIERTQQLARSLGWDLTGWTFEVTAGHEHDWRRLRQRLPGSSLVQWLPTVRYRVYVRPPEGRAAFRAAFGEQGQLLRFGLRGDDARPAPPLTAEQLPALFNPARPENFERWRPGERSFRMQRPPSRAKKRGEGPGEEGAQREEGPPRGGRPLFYWSEVESQPVELRIVATGPEQQINDARIVPEIPRELRRTLDPAGDTPRDVVRGFAVFFVVIVSAAAGYRVLSQIGIRRDYIRLALRTAGPYLLLVLLLLLVGGPARILRYTGWQEGDPAANGIGFFFSHAIGRTLALALPLAAGLLTIRGRHIRPWLGGLGPALRGQWYRKPWLAALAGVAASPALAAIPYIAAALTPGTPMILRPQLDLLYHPAPGFALLAEFPLTWIGGAGALLFLMPWALRPERPSRLRFVLFALGAFLLFSQRVGPLEDNGYAALATVPLWFAGSWMILHRLGLAALYSAWLAALALPSLGLYLLAPAAFWKEALQTAALCALPAVGTWIALRREAPEGDEEEFAAEIDRRNHPDTAPRLRSEREHLLSEFALAREAQQGMLPAAAPDLPGYSLEARCVPAREVGGDLFDYLDLPGGKIGLCVADVSGKGVPAALYMTLTKGMLAAEEDLGSGSRELASSLNAEFYAAGRRRTFVTMVFAALDPATGEVELVRAGHNPALLWRAATGECRYLKPRGIGLGLTGGRLFEDSLESLTLTLAPGDILLLYSDGLTEAMNPAREQFGEQRLSEALARHARLDAAELTGGLFDEVHAFAAGAPMHDDLTVLALKRLELSPAGSATRESAATTPSEPPAAEDPLPAAATGVSAHPTG